jgi:hypothetical protein
MAEFDEETTAIREAIRRSMMRTRKKRTPKPDGQPADEKPNEQHTLDGHGITNV